MRKTAAFLTWARWMLGKRDLNGLEAFNAYDGQTKAAFYQNLEHALLSEYASIPLCHYNTACLVSSRGSFPEIQYTQEAGFGGLRYYSYN